MIGQNVFNIIFIVLQDCKSLTEVHFLYEALSRFMQNIFR